MFNFGSRIRKSRSYIFKYDSKNFLSLIILLPDIAPTASEHVHLLRIHKSFNYKSVVAYGPSHHIQ